MSLGYVPFKKADPYNGRLALKHLIQHKFEKNKFFVINRVREEMSQNELIKFTYEFVEVEQSVISSCYPILENAMMESEVEDADQLLKDILVLEKFRLTEMIDYCENAEYHWSEEVGGRLEIVTHKPIWKLKFIVQPVVSNTIYLSK